MLVFTRNDAIVSVATPSFVDANERKLSHGVL